MKRAGKFPRDLFINTRDNWLCGRDKPCRFGPKKDGRCCMRAECKPCKHMDRWQCTRPVDPCDDGPFPNGQCCYPVSPCIPRATVGYKLKVAVRLGAAFALAVVLLFTSFQGGIFPGELSTPHASFEKDCVYCHVHGNDMEGMWVKAVLHDIADDSRQCVNCHRMGTFALNAHGVDSLEKEDKQVT